MLIYFSNFVAENIYIQQSATVTGGSPKLCWSFSDSAKTKILGLDRRHGDRHGA